MHKATNTGDKHSHPLKYYAYVPGN